MHAVIGGRSHLFFRHFSKIPERYFRLNSRKRMYKDKGRLAVSYTDAVSPKKDYARPNYYSLILK